MSKILKKIVHQEIPAIDYSFFCIYTSLDDYRLCWSINNILNRHLTKTNDYISEDTKIQLTHFSVYKELDKDTDLQYILLANKSNKTVLIPELQTFDFIFCISSLFSETDAQKLIDTIKEIKNVQLVVELSKIKHKPITDLQLTNIMEILNH